MKKCSGQPLESTVSVSGTFRPLTTDLQVRSLGELDIGVQRQLTMVASAALHQQSGFLGLNQSSTISQQCNSSAVPFLPQQSAIVQQHPVTVPMQSLQQQNVQFVYHSVQDSMVRAQ